ncbi:MAG: type II secretion system F family protein, partial [bacterium]
MPTFAYTARSSDGRRVTGRADGASETAVLGDLAARGLTPIRVEPARAAGPRKRIAVRALASSYRQLSELLHAGVPLLRALRILGRSKSNPALARAWAAVA